MKTIAELVEEVRAKFDIDGESRGDDSRLAGLLGVSRQAISQIKRGRTKNVSEKTAFQIAALLDLDPGSVFAQLAIERAKSDRVRRVWESVLDTIMKSAAIATFAIVLLPHVSIIKTMYIMSSYYARHRGGLDSPPGSVTEYAQQENGKNVLLA